MRFAFTLIELLVVITIIVILLALLTPALDKAIYQAELASCGARLKALANGVTVYAMEHGRHYPYRPRAAGGATNTIQHQVRSALPENKPHDDRPALRNYMSITKTLQCVLTQEANLETRHPDTLVFGNYQLWYSWQFKRGPVLFPGSFKIGDRFGFEKDSFSVIASDVFANNPEVIQSSHPDYEGQMFNRVYEDEAVAVPGVDAGYRLTFSGWGGIAGTIDRQFVDGDGAVARFNGVRFEESQAHRMVYIPWRANSAQYVEGIVEGPSRGTFLPRN